MKKNLSKIKVLLFILSLSYFFASCKKDSTCYDCTFGIVNGVQRPPEVWCGDPAHIFTDQQGNAIPSFCRPR
jgi:hypothetical protein